MSCVGILHQPKIPEAEPLAAEISQWVAGQGLESWASSTWDEGNVKSNMARSSVLVVLGGDGSTLHAARLALPHDVPIFGINLGKVGFLSEAQPDNWRERLGRVLQGDFWLEQRLMLHAALIRDGETIGAFSALNDVVVGRGTQARVVRMDLRVDGDLVTRYTADALIVATPTGSTAYSMAAGGPLLPPQLQNFVVVPVAAHLTLARALVLHEEAVISVLMHMDHEAMLTADGQDAVPIFDKDEVIVKKHQCYGCFARVENPGYFYRRLMRRLGYSRSKS
ncbi:MAG: NAD(+)/NADH kinase [Anaerolineae bacterium]